MSSKCASSLDEGFPFFTEEADAPDGADEAGARTTGVVPPAVKPTDVRRARPEAGLGRAANRPAVNADANARAMLKDGKVRAESEGDAKQRAAGGVPSLRTCS